MRLTRLRASPIINARLTRLGAYAPYANYIYKIYNCLQLKGKVNFVCTLPLTIHPTPRISPSSLLFYNLKLFCFFCFKALLTPFFYNYFAAT